MALPAPQPLLALLLLAASLLAEGSDQDSPSCTGDALTVPRGQSAVMFCTVSTPLTRVAIRLSVPGKASRLIFGVDGPGHFSNSGWQLEVRGSEARLVIPDAQPTQAGDYTWFLEGTHGSVRHTTNLNVSELLVTEAASTPPAGTQPPPPASTVSPVPVLPAITVPVLVLAVMAVLVTLAWRRRRRSRNLGRIWQMQMFPAPGPGPEPGAEQGRLAPGMQPEETCPPQSPRHQHQTPDASPASRTPAPDPPHQPSRPGSRAPTPLPETQAAQADIGRSDFRAVELTPQDSQCRPADPRGPGPWQQHPAAAPPGHPRAPPETPSSMSTGCPGWASQDFPEGHLRGHGPGAGACPDPIPTGRSSGSPDPDPGSAEPQAAGPRVGERGRRGGQQDPQDQPGGGDAGQVGRRGRLRERLWLLRGARAEGGLQGPGTSEAEVRQGGTGWASRLGSARLRLGRTRVLQRTKVTPMGAAALNLAAPEGRPARGQQREPLRTQSQEDVDTRPLRRRQVSQTGQGGSDSEQVGEAALC